MRIAPREACVRFSRTRACRCRAWCPWCRSAESVEAGVLVNMSLYTPASGRNAIYVEDLVCVLETKRTDSARAYWGTLTDTSIDTYARFTHTWARRVANEMSEILLSVFFVWSRYCCAKPIAVVPGIVVGSRLPFAGFRSTPAFSHLVQASISADRSTCIVPSQDGACVAVVPTRLLLQKLLSTAVAA